jgi:hypothetical protein
VAALPILAFAQPADHLKCYKVKDPQPKAFYTADLGGLVAEPGCTIKVPALMACVPATKTNVAPAPPGTGGSGAPGAFGCYKVKCPKADLPAIALNDQFGSRTVTPKAPRMLCAPVAPTTTTSTTIPCKAQGESCSFSGTADSECCSGCCDAGNAKCSGPTAPCSCSMSCFAEYCQACTGTNACFGDCLAASNAFCCP